MRRIRISLVGLPAAARTAAVSAARDAFPAAELVAIDDALDAAHRPKAPGLELLVLADTAPEIVVQATQATGDAGLPRAAVVVMGQNTSDLVETVPPAEWSPGPLARVFRSALLQHELLCENLRLRGDLKTVARRFSHDLVTPVGCINTSACVLRIMPPEETESIAAIIQNIEDSSGEISQLVERVSFLIKASADPTVPEPVEMADVVAEVLKELESDIQKHRAAISTPPSWPKVLGIAKLLQAIWRNLLGNALKHGGPAVRIRLEWQTEGEELRFVVTDNGPGVSPAIRPGLFRPFDQLHSGHGVGLGLAIVERLVSLQGGRCGYDIVPEGGARFFFILRKAAA